MNRRLLLATLAVLALVVSAGCLAYVTGGGEVTDETLDAEPSEPYEWGTERDARIELSSDNTFRAVYNVSEGDELRLYRSTRYATEDPLDLRAFRYQYPNGTVINGSTFRERGGEVDRTPDEVWVRFGDGMGDGKVALSGDGSPRRFILPTYVTGSYEVGLPEGYTTDFWLFGHVSPGGYEVEQRDDRQWITWDSVTSSSILVQSYRERDFWIFVAIAVIATGIGLGGYYHFKGQLQELRQRRMEMGLDVEEELEERKDDDDDPPPGMR